MKAWWVAIVCMFVGEIGNFLAYGMAPASLVSPLGAITVISNAVLSKVILNEPMPRQKAVGVVLALVGAYGFSAATAGRSLLLELPSTNH